MTITPLELAELAESLGMAVRPLDRRTAAAGFSRSQTRHLLRISHVLEQAQRLFGDRARGLEWLKHQNRALSFDTPLAQLETRVGAKRVLALLRRIDDRMFA
ncbi:MAG: DUF2384 domain-containing protein [Betaproteobacteria bacterium]|nr:DUF2384 domain-containing protein [Betaproteobacteria bacterium]